MVNINPETKSDIEKNISEEIDEIILKAVEMKEYKEEFKQVVEEAEDKMEAIRSVRVLLKKYFPRVEELDKKDISEEFIIEPGIRLGRGQVFGKKTLAELKIAKGIVDLLWK